MTHQMPGFGSSFGSAGLHQARGGGRVRKTFAQLAKAKLEAETVANCISAGELNILTLTSEDRTSYVRSLKMLKSSGTPLEIAVMQFVETAKLLDGASLLEAAKFYLRHNPRHLPTRTVDQVVEEMIAAKEAEGMSAVHVKDLKSGLPRLRTWRRPLWRPGTARKSSSPITGNW